MTPPVIGIILIIYGTLYILKPAIFKNIIRRKIVFDPRKASLKQYNYFLRILGILLIIIGIFILQMKYK